MLQEVIRPFSSETIQWMLSCCGIILNVNNTSNTLNYYFSYTSLNVRVLQIKDAYCTVYRFSAELGIL